MVVWDSSLLLWNGGEWGKQLGFLFFFFFFFIGESRTFFSSFHIFSNTFGLVFIYLFIYFVIWLTPA